MKKIIAILFLLCVLLYGVVFGQGFVNNGAHLNLTSGVTVYVDGLAGHYTNQNNGLINSSTLGGTVAITGNWINNATNVAFVNDGVTTNLLGANQIIGGTNSTSFYNLNLVGTGTKSLAVSTSVGGQSTLTGVLALGNRPLDLNSNQLEITNSSVLAITNTTGYIISETNLGINPSVVRWDIGNKLGAYIIPFGVSGSLIPFTFNVVAAMSATTAYVNVCTRATSLPNNLPWTGATNVSAVSHMHNPTLGGDGSVQTVIDRWWNITPSHSVTANVTFSYRGIENTLGALYQTGLIGAQHWSGNNWGTPIGSGVAVTSGIGVVTAIGLSNFSPYVLSSVVAPLPIELVSFDAICENEHMKLAWCTATETNNDFFTLEYSTDGTNYLPMANISGSGTINTKKNYSYTVENNLTDVNYFRLKQTDFDGITKTYQVIYSENCKDLENDFTITNNCGSNLDFIVNTKTNENYDLTISNSLGQVLREYAIIVKIGYNKFPIETTNLSDGVYYVSLSNSKKIITKKVVFAN